jgi:hypothetical protein
MDRYPLSLQGQGHPAGADARFQGSPAWSGPFREARDGGLRRRSIQVIIAFSSDFRGRLRPNLTVSVKRLEFA